MDSKLNNHATFFDKNTILKSQETMGRKYSKRPHTARDKQTKQVFQRFMRKDIDNKYRPLKNSFNVLLTLQF